MTATVILVDEVDSTNLDAMRRIAAGETGPLWVRAVRQTAGKGRDGRRWVSEAGNFYGSLIVPLDVPRAVLSQLSLVVAVAVYDAIVEAAGEKVDGLRLKWPNDLLVGAGKLAGILTESTTRRDGGLCAVVGIGINLARPPAAVGRAVAGLMRQGEPIDPAALIAPLDHWLRHWISLWSGGSDFHAVRDAWLARAGQPGETIHVNTGAGPVEGSFQGLADDGALLMQLTGGAVRHVTFGDVRLASES